MIAGDAVTGVTIMRVVKELDAGPMFAAESRPIGPDETSAEVERDLAGMGARLLLDVVDRIAAGRAAETPQDDSQATLRAEDRRRPKARSTGHRPARALHNLIRGLQPWPLAVARASKAERILLHASQPAEEIVATDGAPDVIDARRRGHAGGCRQDDRRDAAAARRSSPKAAVR